MAKYRIDPTLITALTEHEFIDGSGNITITFSSRSGGADDHYEVTFAAATDIIESTNPRMIDSIALMPPAPVKLNGAWIIGDPTTTRLFESVAEADPNPTIDPAASGTEQITGREKNLVVKYSNRSGDGPVPPGRNKATLGPWVTKARNYFRNLRP